MSTVGFPSGAQSAASLIAVSKVFASKAGTMLLLRLGRSLFLNTICVAASSIGALVGYGIGHLAWAALGHTIVEIYGQAENFQRYKQLVEDWGVWIIIAKSFTPIPFKFIAIAAGVASMNLWAFTIATVFGRALHFQWLRCLLRSEVSRVCD